MAIGLLLTEQIVKLDCDRCKLKTEHYVVDYGGSPTLVRCLRCGQVKNNPEVQSHNEKYPDDSHKPIYVR